MKREELLKKLREIGLTYDEAIELSRSEMEMWKGWLDNGEITKETYERHEKKVDEFKERIQKYNHHIIPLEEVLLREDDILD